MTLLDVFRPEYRHSELWVRLASIEKLTDQTILAKVAHNDKHTSARKSAIEKLTDQATLADVAKNDSDASVRKAAIEKITVLTDLVLAEFAKNDSDASVRRVTIEKLNNQTVLAEVAKNDNDASVRKAAIGRLTDWSIISEVAKNDNDATVRKVAIEQLTDWTALAEISKSDSDTRERKAYRKAISGNPTDLEQLVVLLYNDAKTEKTLSIVLEILNQQRPVENYNFAMYFLSRLRKKQYASNIEMLSGDECKRLITTLARKNMKNILNLYAALDQAISVHDIPEQNHETWVNVPGRYEECEVDVWPSPKGGDDNRGGPFRETRREWIESYEDKVIVTDKPRTLAIICNFDELDKALLKE